MLTFSSRYATPLFLLFFFFNDTATTEIYTLSLHDALPISASSGSATSPSGRRASRAPCTAHCSPTSACASSPTIPDRKKHTSELQSQSNLVCRLLLEKKKIIENNK